MDQQNQDQTPQGKCPFHNLFRPISKRVGIPPLTYVFWNMWYWVMEFLNRKLSFNKYRKVSWDKWPTFLGLPYLMGKIRFNRSNAVTKPYDYMANDTKTFGAEPDFAKHFYTPDGTWVSDQQDPQMGAAHTRFGSNIPPKRVRPDVENMTPTAREAGKLRWRRLDENGKEITIPALILNNLAGGWIQFQFHGFGGNTERDPVGVCPHMMKRTPEDHWPGGVARIDRTSKDPTRVTDNGRPTVINERTVAWIQGQLYGSSQEELDALRSYEGGKFKLDADMRLPEDERKPGIDLTGFNENFNPILSFLHWLFASEHNAIADHYAKFHPDWDDERLFQMARKANVAQIARIHTTEWTEDLLQHPTLQLAMHADWYGLMGQRLKMFLMRYFDRHPRISKAFTWLRHSETLWGMPGSAWEHHDGPFQVPVQFRMVYRLHEMVLSEQEIIDPKTDAVIDRVDLLNFVHENTRPIVAKFGYETLAYSFVRRSCGALTLHNFPRALTAFHNQQDGELTDLSERDLFRERTDGIGTYNEFRLSLGEPPVTSFLELTGGDVEMARELEIKYEYDVDKVDAGIGILVEPKPEGFALGFCQFYQFVLNAPRRVKSNRHLTEGYTYAEYNEGLDWVEHAGGILGAMRRHVPGITGAMEGVIRGFAPWKDTETFPLRQLTKTGVTTGHVAMSDMRIIALSVIAFGAAAWTGALPLWLGATLVVLLTAGCGHLAVKRMLAMRFMQQVWKACYTDRRSEMFLTLGKGDGWLRNAALTGKLGSQAIMAGGIGFAWALAGSHPLVAGLFALVALASITTWKGSNTFVQDATLLKIALWNRLRDGQPAYKLMQVPFGVLSMLKGAFGNDGAAFEATFSKFAPGREYITAYDFARMHEAGLLRARSEGGKGWLSSKLVQRRANRQSAQLIELFADTIVEQDRKLVPAISKSLVERFFSERGVIGG